MPAGPWDKIRIVIDGIAAPPDPGRGRAICSRTTPVADPMPLSPLAVSGSPEEKFREFLEIRGEKLTEPRRVLVRHIFDSHKHFDADELVADLRNAGRQVSRSTV